ncbi:oligopeptide transporter [Xylariomycetidae sp. FL2044]|nr:oligopeptide transporter [Xylariomycetidae sp. FL2044]
MDTTAEEDRLPRDATPEEIESCVHEVAAIPSTAWLIAFTGAGSRFVRFGVTIPWQNYLQNPLGYESSPGALGLGQSRASIIQNAFLFFEYLTPICFAIISDMWIGRYKTMLLSLLLLVIGYIILSTTSIPAALEGGAGLGGLVATMILIGLGQGGLSTVAYPLIADQIPESRPQLKRGRDGSLVVTDRKLAIQYVFNGYYWMANIASLSSIPTTLLEKHVGFWAAFLLPTCVFVLSTVPILVWHRRLVKLPPQANALPQAGRIMLYACRSRFSLSAADPEYQKTHHGRAVPWTSAFVQEIRRGLKACRVIICFIIFWLCYNQTTNNIISQAGQTEQYGLSNDTIQALNPIACIIIGPLLQNLLFPFLRRHKISFGPILRMTVSFLFISAGIAYAAGFQRLIYSRGPCYRFPLECPESFANSGNQAADRADARPNEVNVWIQTPLHFLLATGEILGLVSLNEYTYSEAPASTKAVVQAFQQTVVAMAAILGLALGTVSKNPYLTILYATLAGTMAASAVLFWAAFRKYDSIYEKSDTAGENGSEVAESGTAADEEKCIESSKEQ